MHQMHGRLASWAAILLFAASCSGETTDTAPTAEPPAATLEPAASALTAFANAEVIVFGTPGEAADWLRAENWWGEEKRGEQLTVPYALITGIDPRWQKIAQEIPVPDKKEVFYRLLLPLVMHANKMVLDRRERLASLRGQIEAGSALADDDRTWLLGIGEILRAKLPDDAADAAAMTALVDELLYKLDVLPPGLVLGQAAYESGYGTSRFAVEGNALFGQWTYGGEGMVPGKQRTSLGDHRIAKFDWPFDSVRGYYINISGHPAYEPLRRIRAERRAAGKPLTSLAMADGLIRYSERGQKYVDTLKGIIRVNKLDIADDAVLRDEPLRLLVSAESPKAASELRGEIESLRASGELAEIIARMNLD
jgi:Bax protein